MLSYDLAVEVNKYFCTRANHPIILLIGVELAAVNAPVKDRITVVVGIILAYQLLQLFHK